MPHGNNSLSLSYSGEQWSRRGDKITSKQIAIVVERIDKNSFRALSESCNSKWALFDSIFFSTLISLCVNCMLLFLCMWFLVLAFMCRVTQFIWCILWYCQCIHGYWKKFWSLGSMICCDCCAIPTLQASKLVSRYCAIMQCSALIDLFRLLTRWSVHNTFIEKTKHNLWYCPFSEFVYNVAGALFFGTVLPRSRTKPQRLFITMQQFFQWLWTCNLNARHRWWDVCTILLIGFQQPVPHTQM